ncbi:MAG TPA: circularly permuted type 2 ATP-grasp protein [Alphaproteobacteria bacterium]|nr:circularly permuted type 2 ATP-grasp protein [Alphaproteobacteria bacterium]
MTELTNAEASSPVKPEPVYDEMVTGTGHVRAHWQKLMGRLSPLDPNALDDRHDEAVQLLRQHGVTYAVYGDPQGGERPWPLDLIPFIIPAEEWRVIEGAVIQRAQLLNAVLTDVYGSQSLIADGALPPSLIHANSRFLRPCRGTQPPGGTYLHFSAFDLGRTPEGRWEILSDRTQAPSGAGYALENRSVIGRVLADSIGDTQVRPLAPFFSAFRDNLHGMSRLNSRVVLLTPGSYNETYFEHVYLARHLGITLVEGSDLTVRDRQVYLKTLSGLERVGVILRRLDDDFCDPVELRATSALGVAGLMEAVRAGNVVMANALGSGVTEAAAFKPLVPALARRLMGAELELPEIPTWWCARRQDRDYVLANLENLVIKPAFAFLGRKPVFGGDLTRAERDALAQRIKAQPVGFVGQERARLSTAPVWTGERLEPRAMILRVFVAAIGDGFAVMPGGLTRTAPNDNPIISMQLGSGSKDSWVLGSAGEARAVAAPGNLMSLPTPGMRRVAGGELPSRVADGLYWVARYAERSDSIVRLLRTLLIGVTDAIQPWRYRDAEPVLNLAAWRELVPPIDHPGSFQPISLVQAALLDPAHPCGVIANYQRLINAARRVRDRMPHDCWRIFMALDRHIQEPVGPLVRVPPVRLLLRLEELITFGAALQGAVSESMTRDAGWRFLEIGKHVERAISLVEMMRGLPKQPNAVQSERPMEERRLLGAILALTDPRGSQGANAITAIGPEPIEGGFDRQAMLTAVLDNEVDPRSLVYQLSALAEHIAALPRPSGALPTDRGLIDSAVRISLAARDAVADAIVKACQPYPVRSALGEMEDPLRPAFARLDRMIPQISELLTQAYFTHVLNRTA